MGINTTATTPHHTNMKTEIVLMTPAWAKLLLETSNPHNRPVSKRRIALLADQIRQGLWRCTHQGIALSKDGILLDGQHRLAAIYMSGVSVKIALTSGCDPQLFTVIDTGAARTAADCIAIAGAAYGYRAAAGIRMCILYRARPDVVWAGATGKELTTNSCVTDWYYKNRALCDNAINAGERLGKKFPLIARSVYIAFMLLAELHGQESTAHSFLESFVDGAGLEAKAPSHACRRMLINAKAGGKALTSQQGLACLIKVYTQTVSGASVVYFKMPAIPPMPLFP